MEEDELVSDYVGQLLQIVLEMRSVGKELSKGDVLLKFLCLVSGKLTLLLPLPISFKKWIPSHSRKLSDR